MKLFRSYLKRLYEDRAEDNKMKVKIIGDISAFGARYPAEYPGAGGGIPRIMTSLYFQIAMNYGSRDEITRGNEKNGSGCCRW